MPKPNEAYEPVKAWLHGWNEDRWQRRRNVDITGESKAAVLQHIREQGGLDFSDEEIVKALARCGYVIKPSTADRWYLIS